MNFNLTTFQKESVPLICERTIYYNKNKISVESKSPFEVANVTSWSTLINLLSFQFIWNILRGCKIQIIYERVRKMLATKDLFEILPKTIRNKLEQVDKIYQLEELRIKVNKPLFIHIGSREEIWDYIATTEDIKYIMQRISNYSIARRGRHSYE